jgi:hypothetical protein
VLVRLLGQFLGFEGFRAVLVPRRVGATIVYTLLGTIKLGTAGLSLGVYCSYTVSTVGFILIESAKVAELVASKAAAES